MILCSFSNICHLNYISGYNLNTQVNGRDTQTLSTLSNVDYLRFPESLFCNLGIAIANERKRVTCRPDFGRSPAPSGRALPARTDAPTPNPVEGPAEWDPEEPLNFRSLITESRDSAVSDCSRDR